MRSEALVKAQAKYEKKRALKPRLTASYISEEEDMIFKEAVMINGGTKKETICSALELYCKFNRVKS